MSSAADWFPEGYFLTVQDTAVYTYVDADGHEWVYLGYGYEGWVYLDDPESDLRENISAPLTSSPEETPETSLSVTSEGVTSIEAAADPIPEPSTPIPETRTKDFILPLVLAAIAAAASGTVIAVTKKRK